MQLNLCNSLVLSFKETETNITNLQQNFHTAWCKPHSLGWAYTQQSLHTSGTDRTTSTHPVNALPCMTDVLRGASMHTYGAQGLSSMCATQLQMINWNISLKHGLATKSQPSHWAEGTIFQDITLCFRTNSKEVLQVCKVISVLYDSS